MRNVMEPGKLRSILSLILDQIKSKQARLSPNRMLPHVLFVFLPNPPELDSAYLGGRVVIVEIRVGSTLAIPVIYHLVHWKIDALHIYRLLTSICEPLKPCSEVKVAHGLLSEAPLLYILFDP